jgi:hypothetical protein
MDGEKSPAEPSEQELQEMLEAREKELLAQRKRQSRIMFRILLAVVVLVAAVLLCFRENRELVVSLVTGKPLPAAPAPATPPKEGKSLLDHDDSGLAKDVFGFMRLDKPKTPEK